MEIRLEVIKSGHKKDYSYYFSLVGNSPDGFLRFCVPLTPALIRDELDRKLVMLRVAYRSGVHVSYKLIPKK